MAVLHERGAVHPVRQGSSLVEVAVVGAPPPETGWAQQGMRRGLPTGRRGLSCSFYIGQCIVSRHRDRDEHLY